MQTNTAADPQSRLIPKSHAVAALKMTSDPRTDEAMRRIAELDLDCIKFKLMNTEDGEGWTREQVDKTEKWYKRFLSLMILFPEKVILPTKLVDKFWHYHILDTQKYAEDCQDVFGYFVHHFPYFGMRGVEDKANLMSAGAETADLYTQVFGESVDELGSAFSLCGPDNCAGCNNSCSKPGVGMKFSTIRPTLS